MAIGFGDNNYSHHNENYTPRKYERLDGVIYKNGKEKYDTVRMQARNISRSRVSFGLSTGKSVLSIIIGLLFLVGIVQVINHPDTAHFPTFTGLLEFFSNLEVVQVPFISSVSKDLGDWGVFNWFRDFVAGISGILNVFVFLFNGVIGLVQYIVSFMQFIFM